MNYATYEDYLKNIEQEFSFLINEFGFTICEKSKGYVSYLAVFMSPSQNLRVYLSFDIKENFLYFLLIRGMNTRLRDDEISNVKPFLHLALKYNLDITSQDLQPIGDDYITPLKRNAALLHEYGKEILTEKCWFDT